MAFSAACRAARTVAHAAEHVAAGAARVVRENPRILATGLVAASAIAAGSAYSFCDRDAIETRAVTLVHPKPAVREESIARKAAASADVVAHCGARETSETASSTTPKIVIVTGASGRIGGHMLREMRDAGYIVVGVNGRNATIMDGVDVMKADLSDRTTVHTLLGEIAKKYGTTEIASVIHSAGIYGFEREPDMEKYIKGNVTTTQNLIHELTESGFKVHQFVLFSTQAVLASATEGKPITEESPTREDYAYAATKMMAEREVGKAPFPTVIIRVPSVVESKKAMNHGMATILTQVITEDPLGMAYPGDPEKNGWSYMDMDDFTRAIRLVVDAREELERETPHELYHVGESGCTTHAELRRAIAEASGHPGFTIPVPQILGEIAAFGMGLLMGDKAPVHPWMVRALGRVELDTTKFERRFGFKPDRKVIEGVNEMVAECLRDPITFCKNNGIDPEKVLPHLPAYRAPAAPEPRLGPLA